VIIRGMMRLFENILTNETRFLKSERNLATLVKGNRL